MTTLWRPIINAKLCLRCCRRVTLWPNPVSPSSVQLRSVSLNTAINDSLRSRDKTPRTNRRKGPPRLYQDPNAINNLPRPLIKPSVSHSEFLLGPHSVLAALRLRRRKVLKLYYEKDMVRGSQMDRGIKEILRLAKDAHIEALSVPKSELERVASSPGRPHNGVILEVMPIPFPSVDALLPPDDVTVGHFFCIPHGQASSQRVKVPYMAPRMRSQPLIVMPCNVVDVHNIAAIIRSAYFFSVAALALPTRSTAHPSSFSRASAGAIEAVPLLGVPDPTSFLTKSKHAGFKVLATTLPPVTTRAKSENQMWGKFEHFRVPSDMVKLFEYTSSHPTILLLGSESTGVPEELIKLADATVSIERARETDEAGIDSLNVSVAAGIIFSALSNGKS